MDEMRLGEMRRGSEDAGESSSVIEMGEDVPRVRVGFFSSVFAGEETEGGRETRREAA